jgi:squalene-hopene/tetraprenyl-beta-curcumene cyclase
MDINSPDANLASSQLASEPQLRFGKIDGLAKRVAAALEGARKFLFSQQHEEGYWCGELEADTTLESDYILLHTLLGTLSESRELDHPTSE